MTNHLPSPIARALSYALRTHKSDRFRRQLAASIDDMGWNERFRPSKRGPIVRQTDEERRAPRGAASNPRIKPLVLSDQQRAWAGVGIGRAG